MPSIALVGPGAIGCTVLAHLAQSRKNRLTVGAKTPFSEIVVETDSEKRACQPTVLTDPASVAETADWIILATKTYHVESALPWLDRFTDAGTRIAIVQNGVEHLDRLPSRFSRSSLVPVIIDCPAERISPGRVHQRGPVLITVPDDPAGRAFVDLFENTSVKACVTNDWKTVAWKKLCINAAGAVSAATLRPTGITRFTPIADVMRGLIREVIQVGRAEGAQLDDSIVEAVIEGALSAPPDSVNSMHADRIAGRPMEIDARNGVVARLGRRHGISTPYNETLTALLQAFEQPEP